MADDSKKFDLEIGTKADTSGLEATERALKAVETAGQAAANPMADGSQLAATGQAAEETDKLTEAYEAAEQGVADLEAAVEALAEAQRKEDVERAKAMKSARAHQEALNQVAAASNRLVAIQLAANLNQIAQSFRGASVETDAVLDGVNAMTAGLMTGNPYVALGTAAVAAGKMIHGAYQEAAEADRYYAQSVVNGQKMIETALEAKRIRGRKSFLEEHFARGNAEMVEAMANLERLDRMLKAQRGADTSDREADQRAAVRGGADAVAVDRADITGDQRDAMNELKAGVDAANAKADQLAIKASTLEANQESIEKESGFTSEEAQAAKKAAEEAKTAAETAAKEAEVIAFEAIAESAEIYNEGMDRVAENATADNEALVAKVESVVKTIEASGQELDAAQQAALDRSKEALADGKLTAQEQQQFATDFQGTLSSVRVTLEKQQELQKQFIEITQGQQKNTSTLAGVAAQLKREVDQLRIDINSK